jgi:hypothetical protein
MLIFIPWFKQSSGNIEVNMVDSRDIHFSFILMGQFESYLLVPRYIGVSSLGV